MPATPTGPADHSVASFRRTGVTGRRARIAAALLGVVAALLLGPMASAAHADPLAAHFDATATVDPSGSVAVTETVTFEGTPPGQLVQKLHRREHVLGDMAYVVDYSQVSAKTASGTNINATVDHGRDLVQITVPTTKVAEPIVISYVVTGATVSNEGGGTQLRLNLLQGLSVPVRTVTATVKIPGQFRQLGCVAGPPGTDQKCKTAQGGTDQSPTPTFTDGPRGIGEIVAARITFPAGVVAVTEHIEHEWTVARAFSARLPELLAAIAVLVVGAVIVFALHRRGGVDAHSDEVTRIAEFAPAGNDARTFTTFDHVHPGHVGTLADEHVDPVDVTASLIDLAVRGHLVITELPPGRQFARTDWTLTRTDGGAGDDLRPFEAELLEVVAPQGGSVRVSELGSRVHDRMHEVQGSLYDELVERGWYEQRPDRTRNSWFQTAIVVLVLGVALTGVLAAFTTFGLVGLAVVIVALALLVVSQEMPARTRQGVAVMRGLEALRAELLSAPTDRMPKGRELVELSRVLPFAVVLGGSRRWLDAIVAADDDVDPDPTDLDWFHGPDDWHLRDLPHSLDNFITTVSGSLFTR